jgi:hypothetical protein
MSNSPDFHIFHDTSDLNDPRSNPFDLALQTIYCNLCYLNIPCRDFYIQHPSGENFHITCMAKKRPGDCFYCCSTIDINSQYYTWYDTAICYMCIFKTCIKGGPDTPRLMNATYPQPPFLLGLSMPVPPILDVEAQLFDFEKLDEIDLLENWEHVFDSDDNIDFNCYEILP